MIANGVTFPPGSFAIYAAKTFSVLMWNTPANHDLFMQLLAAGFSWITMVNLKISVVEYVMKDDVKFAVVPVAVSEFSKQLAEPMQLLDSASLVIYNTGHKCEISRTVGFPDKEKGTSGLGHDETGLKIDVWTNSTGVDSVVQARLHCHFRSEPGMTGGKPMSFDFATDASLQDRRPLVIYTAAIPNTAHTARNRAALRSSPRRNLSIPAAGMSICLEI